MPIFEYQCRSCECDFEELVRSEEAATQVKCPKCGGKKVARRLSVFAARQASSSSSPSPQPGGCGRCGDPRGSCGM